jgi:hypothetical protein
VTVPVAVVVLAAGLGFPGVDATGGTTLTTPFEA